MPWDWDKLQQQKKGPGGGGPPNMEEIFEKVKNARTKFPRGIGFIVIIILIFILGYSSFYTVGVDEVGVVQRFGKYVRTTQPGLNFKLPTGIEKVTKVKVRYVFKEEFGFRTIQAGVRTRYATGSAYMAEALMLTGDLNVAVVPWIVQYRINDPYKFLFKVRDPRGTLRDLSEATMRLVVGDRSINEVISKREEIAAEAKRLLQKELNEAETGIKVVNVELKKTNVPEPVQPSFNEVNQAIQEKEKLIYQAREQYNKVIPAAKGNAEKTIMFAQGYALERVNKAKDVTRRRLYLEAISEIFPNIGKKYIVDAEQKNLLPFLNLEARKGGGK
ncbi:MAG: FtsH protease activity modulator HflK [Deltaproteobacteria bacterium]|nr:MAG: FtsH protease activity modulator HflK [Deltaproteobacteria bacterium]